MAKTSKTINVFLNDYYKRRHSVIATTKVDENRLRNSPLSPEQVAEVKRKYSITSYSSKADFDVHYGKAARVAVIREMREEGKTFKSKRARERYINEEVDRRLTKQYDFYEHRELLIKTGQYEELRSKQYKEQYISHLKLANVDADVIENIKRLTPEQWTQLTSFPDAIPGSARTRELPHLQDIYSYSDDTANKYEIIREEIIEAFKDAGLEFKDYKNKKYQTQAIKRRKFAALAQAYYEGRLEIKYHKETGTYSIPFIGSTKGKNSQIAKDFINYLDAHSDEYQ